MMGDVAQHEQVLGFGRQLVKGAAVFGRRQPIAFYADEQPNRRLRNERLRPHSERSIMATHRLAGDPARSLHADTAI